MQTEGYQKGVQEKERERKMVHKSKERESLGLFISFHFFVIFHLYFFNKIKCHFVWWSKLETVMKLTVISFGTINKFKIFYIF